MKNTNPEGWSNLLVENISKRKIAKNPMKNMNPEGWSDLLVENISKRKIA